MCVSVFVCVYVKEREVENKAEKKKRWPSHSNGKTLKKTESRKIGGLDEQGRKGGREEGREGGRSGGREGGRVPSKRQVMSFF